ncbi:MAG: toll/interleukin-1 receptor domain-containing protein [Verrucomicrobia bacterium]|nr:toll/interleukin-1 receptor domain-containing protein [Verrucomicrobiota bacterium]
MTTPRQANSSLQPAAKYELFISYSRKDNVPRKPGDPKGWVTALRDEILADHRRFSTEPLRIFFDTEEIRDMDDWRHRILTGLRESRILLVCLSPDYFKSPPCLWEWEEYLKRQVHALMGQDSVAPVYFVEAPDSDEQLNAAWAEAATRKAVTPADRPAWEKKWKAWHEATLDRPNWVDLKPWFPNGVEALREAAVREKLAALGTSLWERIQRARRATGVPGNLRRLNPHFIGRRTELRQLHENLALGAVGVVTAVHGLGGQGKTELAAAYAHGWADSYPAGLWVLGAEGKKEILPLLGELCAELQIPLATGPDETAEARGRRVLTELKRRALEAAPRDPDKGAACLVILDNVSEPALLAEPQLAQIPREDWLRVVVTTREGPEKFPASRKKSLAFIAVDALTEDDAARLIEDHQIETDGQWPAATAAADTAAAREIARELGGFTLAVESVAIYLGLHPDIRPADYLARLRAEGLTGVDALPADTDVAAQMQHREKQLRLVLNQTLARLTPAERTALDYAALLPPDSIPWPWLRALVEQEHPTFGVPPSGGPAFGVPALAGSPTPPPEGGTPNRPGYPDPWQTLRRRLEGLRLLTPGDHVEIARLHRMVAAHIAERNAHQMTSMLSSVDKFLDSASAAFERTWMHDPAVLWLGGPLQETVRFLADKTPNLNLAEIAGIVAWVEREIGRLDRSLEFLQLSERIAERIWIDNSADERAVRTLSITLNQLGDFCVQRGKPGDAEKALGHYQRSLEVRERLRLANPESAQAARDVAAGLQRLGDFRAARGLPGDAEEALRCYERCLQATERLLTANPDSADAARDVSVSLNLLADFLARRGLPGDAEKALGHYQRSLEVAERLLRANPESAQAARDVSVSLDRLGDFLAGRGLPGDAEKALDHYQRCHEVLERLLVANPESAQAARDVSVSLNKLADFLASRGLPGDAEKALGYFERDLEISERLLLANPESAQAARDVSVSLEKLADFLARRGLPGDAEKALAYYERDLEISERLLLANPASAAVARDVVVSHYKLAQFGMQTEDEALTQRHNTECHRILHGLISQGVTFDPPVMGLYQQLHGRFGGGA